MAERSDIPHLIELLDDTSPDVREHVLRELLSFGPTLDDEVRALVDRLTPVQRRVAEKLLHARRKAESRWDAWTAWPDSGSSYEQLETAFELLAQFQYGWAPPVSLRELLDDLARDFLTTCHARDALSLSRFLFSSKGLHGNEENYHAPMNSNLIHVIQNGSGLPISLACIFMLVGHRCGVTVDGCCAPGHFLARAKMGGMTLFFDCFNKGHILTEREVGQIRAQVPLSMWRALVEPAEPVDIIRRVLNNLIHAYESDGDEGRCQLMRDLQGCLPLIA